MGLIDSMKERIKNSGTSRKEVFYVGADSKRRVRFLQELDDGFEFKFHSHWSRGVNALCAEVYGKDCPYCSDTDEEMKEITQYAWSVWDYDANAVRILLYKATGISPVPQLIEFAEEYGTICDRDYTIKKIGKGMSGSITVIPSEVNKFKNKKAKAFTYKQIVKLLEKAYPINSEDEENDEDEEVKSKSKKTSKNVKKKNEPTIEEKLSELSLNDLRNIAIELGVSKKELKGLDEEEIVELLIDDNEEDELEEAYQDYIDDNEYDEDEEEDEDEDEEE